MMDNNFIPIRIQKIFQYYQLIARINSAPPLKIVAEEMKDRENTLFTVQLTGKNIFPKLSARELIDNNKIFSNFSDADKEKIRKATERRFFPISKKVLKRNFDPISKECIFAVKILDIEKIEFLSAREIINKFKDLKGFDEEDAFLIGLELGKNLN